LCYVVGHNLPPGNCYQVSRVLATKYPDNFGVRDQPAYAVADMGVALLADPYVGDHAPNQLQVDFRERHSGAMLLAGNRDSHIGLRSSREMDRPKPAAVFPQLPKADFT
jgi:hypothetical protein